MTAFAFEPIATVESPFQSKFAVPRQSGLATEVSAFVRVDPVWRDALVGLEAVSHVWLVFVFNRVDQSRSATRTRPPRLGGNTRLGVFATRSTHRPNPIGLSLARVDAIEPDGLRVRGVDLLHGTPVLDIKPYVPWADRCDTAVNTLSPAPPPRCAVHWSAHALSRLATLGADRQVSVRALLEDVLQFEARPAYHSDPNRQYGTELAELEVRWRYPTAQSVEVLDLLPLGLNQSDRDEPN
ncbi:MAG: tRNA (N6-threonylcarbamoyladenosine(37)-N6)-methyltransferase TrmO [Pseudomonadota bacterium]